jgi:formylglycine-generating enzyme required for sulfatase activity
MRVVSHESSKDYKLAWNNDVELEMRWIMPGEFMMGRKRQEYGGLPRHAVRLDGYWIGVTEVTQEQYEAVMGENPSHFKGPLRPVDGVSWFDARRFCQRLSRSTGHKYTLPTEAQWERACRAGTDTIRFWGDGEEEIGDYAWFFKNSGDMTHPVKTRKPNPWGLYDMLGNVEEWCHDWFVAGYYKPWGIMDNPKGPCWLFSARGRVLRGAAFEHAESRMRSDYRSLDLPSSERNTIGFRLCRVG